jgi:hypothetical protein
MELTSHAASGALMPLQAVLSGLAAFRDLENHPRSEPVADFRPHLHAVRVAYRWALDLVSGLRCDDASGLRLCVVGQPFSEPESSLRGLERSLVEGLRMSERLLALSVVDAGALLSSCDPFLSDLSRNAFLRPPAPLEFPSGRASVTTMIAFLSLLRCHRFLGIAEGQIGSKDGLYRAHVVLAAVRRELRSLLRFLVAQGAESFADELEARLRTVRSTLDEPLPERHPAAGAALAAERMQAGIVELRATLKDAAKRLRSMGRPAPKRRQSERVRKSIHQEAWAFRFILQAFIAKASAASVAAESSSLEFTEEFVRHFRVFGPRLTSETDYSGHIALTQAVSSLRPRRCIDAATLDLAARECALFLKHLDETLASTSHALLPPFDKHQAAADLRRYLSAARDRTATDPAAAGAFGLFDRRRAEAS